MTRRINIPVEIPAPSFEEMPDLLVEMAEALRKMSASSIALSKLAESAETDRVGELREKLQAAEQRVEEYTKYCADWESAYNELKAQPAGGSPEVTVWVRVYEAANTMGRFHTKNPCPSGRGSDVTAVTVTESALAGMKAVPGIVCPTCAGDKAQKTDWWPAVGEMVKLLPNNDRPSWITGLVKGLDREHNRVSVQPKGHGYAVMEELKFVRPIKAQLRAAA